MGNQQGINNFTSTAYGRVQDIEWAWLAGMLNGDGCFSLQLRKREKRWKCDVSINLTQCDPCIIEKTSDILDRGLGCNPYIHEYKPSGAGINTKYNLRITKMSIMSALIDKIMPYMCGAKQAKAKLMQKYLKNRMQYKGKSRKRNTIQNDHKTLSLAKEFYDLSGTKIPKEIMNALRDYPQGVGSSDSKRTAPKGEDIVQSCVKAQAAI